MTKTVAQKMGIQQGASAVFIQAPKDVVQTMDLPALDVSTSLSGKYDYIHLFVINQQEFISQFVKLKKHLSPLGTLWVSWPKNKQLQTDLSLKSVIKLGYDFGLVESTCLSIDATWSALKFTHPKKGKVYKNSYGKLNTRE